MLIFPATFGSVSILSLNPIGKLHMQIKFLNLISLINSLNFIKNNVNFSATYLTENINVAYISSVGNSILLHSGLNPA